MKSHEDLKALHGETYVKNFSQSTKRLHRLLKHIELPAKAEIVDYGCGNGILMELLSPAVQSYTGVDFSTPFINAALAKQQTLNIKNAEFHCSDIHDFCCRNSNKFDAAFAMDFSEHVYDSDWLQILISIRNTLKPGGSLFLHTPNAEFFLEIMKKHNFIIKQFPEHIAVRNLDENSTLLKKAGFDEISSTSLPHYNILRYLHGMSYIPKIGRFFSARIFLKALNRGDS